MKKNETERILRETIEAHPNDVGAIHTLAAFMCYVRKDLDKAERLYGPGTEIRIENVELDSFGRAVADIRRYRSDRWLYFAKEMVDSDMAEAWQEGWPDIDWCELAKSRAE